MCGDAHFQFTVTTTRAVHLWRRLSLAVQSTGSCALTLPECAYQTRQGVDS